MNHFTEVGYSVITESDSIVVEKDDESWWFPRNDMTYLKTLDL